MPPVHKGGSSALITHVTLGVIQNGGGGMTRRYEAIFTLTNNVIILLSFKGIYL